MARAAHSGLSLVVVGITLVLLAACGARSALDEPQDAEPSADATVAVDAESVDASVDASYIHDATVDASDATMDAMIDATIDSGVDASDAAILGCPPLDAAIDAPLLSTDASVVTVAVGATARCALLADGGVLCWGGNMYGQLGDGTTTNSSTPVAPTAFATAALISAASSTTCAVDTSNGLWCWGVGGWVGDGTSVERDSPVKVIDAGVAGVSGDYTTCAVFIDGGVQCWGDNFDGTIGDGTMLDRLAPVNIGLASPASSIASGDYQTCAVLLSGGMECWGENFDGQLGDGTKTDHLTPVPVVSLGGGAKAVATGEAQVCALLTDGTVRCWGDGASGQLGNGKLTIVNEKPATVPLCTPATGIACGQQFCCASLASGGVRCWGENGAGQLGDGTTTQRPSPVDVVSLADSVVAISALGTGVCALLVSGAVECWGNGSATPTTISGLP